MPVYKDKKTNTWYCKFYYEDYTGSKKQKFKRSFKLKKEAQEYEREFLTYYQKTPDMTFSTLLKRYERHVKSRIKESTYNNKTYILHKYVLPFFSDMPINQIAPQDVDQWHSELSEHNYSQEYVKLIHTEFSTVLNYAVNYCNLTENPVNKTTIPQNGKPKREMQIWSAEQFKTFITHEKKPIYIALFNLLYYTGMRLGEALALNWDDIDFSNHCIKITKTYRRHKKKDIITKPKTKNSIRSVIIFPQLEQILMDYKKSLYKPGNSRIFTVTGEAVRWVFRSHASKQNLPVIRVHDLRHSHASLLIELNFNPVVIANRLGHKSVKVTLDTYSHLYPNKQDQIATRLEEISKNPIF